MKIHPTKFTCDYFNTIYKKNFVEIARRTLREVQYDTMVGTGFSGVLAVAKLSHALRKNALYLRKDQENSHSHQYEEGYLGKKWIIVDDFMDSGATIKKVYKHVNRLVKKFNSDNKFVGVYLYESRRFIKAGHRDLKDFFEEEK